MNATREYHIEFGRHSNIPDCCIEWFIGGWSRIWDNRRASAPYRVDVEYVPCPTCLKAQRFVKVHVCNGCDAPIKNKYN